MNKTVRSTVLAIHQKTQLINKYKSFFITMSIYLTFRTQEDFNAIEDVNKNNTTKPDRDNLQKILLQPSSVQEELLIAGTSNVVLSSGGNQVTPDVTPSPTQSMMNNDMWGYNEQYPFYAQYLTRLQHATDFNNSKDDDESSKIKGFVDPSTNDFISMKYLDDLKNDVEYLKRMEKKKERRNKRSSGSMNANNNNSSSQTRRQLIMSKNSHEDLEMIKNSNKEEGEGGRNDETEESLFAIDELLKKDNSLLLTTTKGNQNNGTKNNKNARVLSSIVTTLDHLKWPSRQVESPLHPNEMPISHDSVLEGSVPPYASALLFPKACGDFDRDGYFDPHSCLGIPVGFKDSSSERKKLLLVARGKKSHHPNHRSQSVGSNRSVNSSHSHHHMTPKASGSSNSNNKLFEASIMADENDYFSDDEDEEEEEEGEGEYY